MADESYDPARIEALRTVLRELAQRILQLDADGRLLDETPGLLQQLGDVRSELFQYEVRTTYDTPEVAENRRIVDDAVSGWTPGQDDNDQEDEGWQPPDRR